MNVFQFITKWFIRNFGKGTNEIIRTFDYDRQEVIFTKIDCIRERPNLNDVVLSDIKSQAKALETSKNLSFSDYDRDLNYQDYVDLLIEFYKKKLMRIGNMTME